MIKQLQSYIQNKQKIGVDEFKKILGSDAKVKQGASIWKTSGDIFELIAAVQLHKWQTENDFTKDELSAYRAGLAEIPVFLAACCALLESEKEGENKT